LINGEIGENCYTNFHWQALQGNTPKGVFFKVVFIPIFKAPFKYVSIEPAINQKNNGNLLLCAIVHLHECLSATCG
jgi:hypothetical protein